MSMPPPAKRARLAARSSSPSRSSTSTSPASSSAKGSSRRPLGAHQPPRSSPLKRATLHSTHPTQSSDDDDDVEGAEEDPLAAAEQQQQQPTPRTARANASSSTSYITASTGDSYLLASAATSKTSDNLLSHSLSPAFTLPSYTSALASHDQHPSLASQRQALSTATHAYDTKYFAKWLWEMEQGFNLLLHGFGSKREVVARFGEKAREKGEVLVVEGFDPQVGLGDVVGAMEEVVKGWERENEPKKGGSAPSPKKRKGGSPRKGSPKKGKGKGKATAADDDDDDAFDVPTPKLVLPPSLSALESRIRRLLHTLHTHQSPLSPHPPRPPIYLLLHSLDGPSLRLPKTLSLLALLAAQPGVHLLATVDHLRAAMLFPSSLVTTRPEGMMQPYVPTTTLESPPEEGAEKEEGNKTPPPTPATAAAAVNPHLRTFTFLPYHVPTLAPYTLETSHSSTLSRLLPPSIFPRLSTSDDPSAQSVQQSTKHVLASVTERARRVFEALGRMQVEEEWEGEGKGKGKGLMPAVGQPAPGCAVALDSFKNHCTDRLLAAHNDQVDALLAEFRDHGVVRGSLVAPVRAEEEEDEDEQGEGGEWIWIPLDKAGLQEVLEEMEGGE